MGRCLSQDCNEKDKITIGIDSLEALIVHSKQRKLPFVSRVFFGFHCKTYRVMRLSITKEAQMGNETIRTHSLNWVLEGWLSGL